ncbi:Membrane protein involved in the export of O-antigen and teichoic acid [Selenomonas sp. GACV-9]|uniref:lipopolysaccharide biosynthesis protein n=1 Tax=Selenomonas sp. GACV-9 TaxID=3158782 RepID=UPI0008E55B72|nr:Membrane protein involved in the export of O-antigen and teichoic acid [Selenomonas ruminantium]
MFNKRSKLRNIILSSSAGVAEQLVFYITSFAYRTVFIFILSQNYLGINGLFTNVLQIFSLAELGIGSVITYKLYSPIKENNVQKCAEYLYFYKYVYMLIAGIVLLLSICFYPFLFDVIKDTSEVPGDVDLRYLYWIFVAQNVVSYLFVYWQAMLLADQKGYMLSSLNMISNVAQNLLKIFVLWLYQDYTITITVGIMLSALYNIVLSKYIIGKYSEVAERMNDGLSRSEKLGVIKDTMALMCHKVGYVVANATDSLILSKYIGISTLGVYSNYAMLMMALDSFMNKIFGSFVSTIGNMSIGTDPSYIYQKYRELLFLNLWVASLAGICYYILVNPFIMLWIGETYLLDITVVMLLSTHIFLNSSRIINSSFINANGLFVKDKPRPLIEAGLNLVFSIYLVQKIGLPGVFLGTIFSTVLTVGWRDALILYRNVFHRPVIEYYIYYLKWFMLSLVVGEGTMLLCSLVPISVIGLIIRTVICLLLVNVVYYFIFRNNVYWKYLQIVFNRIRRK